MRFYILANPPTKLSYYRLNRERYEFPENGQKLVTVINYCLMPTHFHLTLKQEMDNGIRVFVQRLTNSFAHFYNKKFKNLGPLFQGNFKSIRIENEEQLMHLSRYIHLNPVTAFIVESPEDYIYSSYRIYMKKEKDDFVDPSFVLSLFGSTSKYQNFVLSRKDYQRTLGKTKTLLFE